MTPLQTILVVAGGLLVLATFLPLIRRGEWWFRLWDFPRSQIALLLAMVLAAGFVALEASRPWHLAVLIVFAAALGWQLRRIFPYTPLSPTQVKRIRSCDPGSRLRLLTANVLMENRRANDFLGLIRRADPDLVLVLEGDDWWDAQLAALDVDYPFSLKHPTDDTYGMHFFSRLELDAPEIRFLVEERAPSVRTRVRLRSGRWIDFYGVHPTPPTPGQHAHERDAELLLVGKEAKAAGRPAVVAGDLNDVAWSHTTRLFQRISGLLDPRIGRGLYGTFHARYPGFRWPLDHIFHDQSFLLVELRRLGYIGSDHFPVLIELCHHPPAAAVHDAPASDSGDRQEATEKIEEGRETAADPPRRG